MRRLLISLIFVLITCLTQSTEARKLALLVGVDEYANVSSLKCCVNDMNILKEALQKVGFDESDIQVLKTGSASIQELPTRENIERKIAEILADARSSDVIFLAFSGHGMREDETDYFCPPFADPEDIKGTCVSITKVMDDLARSKARLKWMVVDACRNESTNSRDARAFQVIPSAPAGIVLFQSCAKGQKSYEEERIGGNGYFTKNFASALSGAADTNHDGQLTLMEVCDWTIDQTEAEVERKENKTQRPYLKGELTKFILTKDLNVPKAKALAEEAQKAMDAEDYKLAIEKYDAALALCPRFESWKRERDLAQKLLEKEQTLSEAAASTPKFSPTSRDSFEWDGTKITKFIGKETEVVIPDGTTEIGLKAFYGCSSLTSVVIPGSVTKIESWAFNGCSSLTSVVIPEGVTEMGAYVFFGCSSLTSLAIPNSIKEISSQTFKDCESLKEWSISSDHPYFKTDGPGLLTKDGKKLVACLPSATEYRIPEGVTEIESYAFDDCSSLMSVVIPESVTEIGMDAFSCCSSLTSAVIPEGVTKIGYSAFSGCSSLTSVVIPESVTEIGVGAFRDCASPGKALLSTNGKYLLDVNNNISGEFIIPDSVKIICPYAFEGCSSLTSLVIPDSVEHIGPGTFVGCTALKEWSISPTHLYFKTDGTGLLTKDGKKLVACLGSAKEYQIPDGVTEIEGRAFEGCHFLTSVVIPEGVTEIGWSAFYRCSSLTSVVIPNGVTEIEGYTFSDCSALTSVVIPESVTEIGMDAFARCSSLTSIVIPECVTFIGDEAFKDCLKLTIHAPNGSKAEEYAKENSIPFEAKRKGDSVQKPYEKNQPQPESSASISKLTPTSRDSFEWGGTKITKFIGKETEVVIPEGVTEIGDCAFQFCSSLTSVVIPASVTKIESFAFSYCSSLTSIVIPEGVTEMGAYIFSGCSSLTSIVIPNSMKEIRGQTFKGCESLKGWSISSDHPYFKTDGTALLTKDGKALVSCLPSAKEYRIPEGVKEIESRAFSDCRYLTSVVIPEGVTEIEDDAFSRCSSLTSVEIPDSVKEIGGEAFAGCTSLKEWPISSDHPYFKTDGIGLQTKDGKKLVACLPSAKEYRIPEDVTEIGRSAFYGCSSLTSMVIPKGITKIEGYEFYGCSSLTSVVIPEGVTEIGWSAFYGCSSLTSMVIPKGITEIEGYAFSGCSSLTSVVIPEGVTEIGVNAFDGCSSLTSIVIPDSVTVIDEEAFKNCPKLTIHAPKGSKAEEYAKENNIQFEAK